MTICKCLTAIARVVCIVLISMNINGCSAPARFDLNLDSNTLVLNETVRPVVLEKKRRIFLPPVEVRQYVVWLDAPVTCAAVFEHADLQEGYAFGHSLQYTVDALFDARETRSVATHGNIYLFELLRRDETAVYVLAEEWNGESLKMLYASSQECILAQFASLGEGDPVSIDRHSFRFLPSDNDGADILTGWSYPLLWLKTIVSPTYRDGFRP